MKSNLHRLGSVLLLLVFVLAATAQSVDDLRQASGQIASSITLGPSTDTLRELSDGIGGRLTGSPSYQKAAEWAAAKFRSYGIRNVHFESFTLPNGWARGTATAQIIAPLDRPLHVASLGWSPSTPAGGVQGAVVLLGDVSADNIHARAAQIRGNLVMLDSDRILSANRAKGIAQIFASYKLLGEAGAVAILSPDREKDNVLNAHEAGWGAGLSPIPALQLGMEDAKLVRRLLESPNAGVTLKVDVQNKTSGPTQANNVIAEIRGSDRPDEWILLGAHLDSWDLGTGAQDNGTGSVAVLEAARVLASLPQAPRRSIRFALWGGEEEGLLGSYAYAQAHSAELGHCIAVLNTDNGAGRPKGWKVQARPDLLEAMRPISSALLKDFGGEDLSLDVSYDTDHGPFLLFGVPALDLEVDMSHYMEIHHKSSDTFDKVDPQNLKAAEAIMTVTAYAIAQDSHPLAAHLDHKAVGEIVKKTGFEDLMIDAGQWKP